MANIIFKFILIAFSLLSIISIGLGIYCIDKIILSIGFLFIIATTLLFLEYKQNRLSPFI